MYAVVAQLIILSTVVCALQRTSNPNDVIWFPIEGYQNGYTSSIGDYYVPQQSDQWNDNRFSNAARLPNSRRVFRSVLGYTGNNKFDTGDKDLAISPDGFWYRPDFKRATRPEDPIVFPGETKTVNDDQVVEDCKLECPMSPEYNPVCGSDLINYRNPGALKCAQLCGKNVRFRHHGICGRSLPGIFVPKPTVPRTTTERTLDTSVWDDRIDVLFKHLRI